MQECLVRLALTSPAFAMRWFGFFALRHIGYLTGLEPAFPVSQTGHSTLRAQATPLSVRRSWCGVEDSNFRCQRHLIYSQAA